ncbi:biotin carboxylase [Paeniglutamicibacter sp. R2-26]|uniref:biotin carboxylase n=1 Tax=Paeniglutamicibacter sp. R2-26 TaxID=3144417 RepID=UPI003EE571E6
MTVRANKATKKIGQPSQIAKNAARSAASKGTLAESSTSAETAAATATTPPASGETSTVVERETASKPTATTPSTSKVPTTSTTQAAAAKPAAKATDTASRTGASRTATDAHKPAASATKAVAPSPEETAKTPTQTVAGAAPAATPTSATKAPTKTTATATKDGAAAPSATKSPAARPAAESAPATKSIAEPAAKTPAKATSTATKAGDTSAVATAEKSATDKPAAKTTGAKPAASTGKAGSASAPATKAQETKIPAAAPADQRTAEEPAPRATPTGPEAPEATIGTDAAFASTAPALTYPQELRNISEVRHFFRTNDVPIFFIGATPFNLLGLDRWVRNFTYISYYNAWDGAHPRVFTPALKPYREFESGEEINNWLLLNAEVRARMSRGLRPGVRPKVAMVFFNEETEQICNELGYDLILPSAELRHRLDSKIVTTQLGNEAGAPSVPNVLTQGVDWKTLRAEAEKAGLGDELVVQTPYGDSGKTTFFISTEAEWDTHAAQIVGQEIKVMRRINNLAVAVEAVLTRSGTVVGPFLAELAGHQDLTPYPGGWCGNEMHPDVLTSSQRTRAMELVQRMGDRLVVEGYRGFFEVDVLVDLDTDEVYLGELNPRISGASAITNVTAGAYADVPLFLFHLLEYMDVDFELDVKEINERWEALSGADVWSHMIIKETSDRVELLSATPATGLYYLDANGALVFSGAALDWHLLQNESEAFFLRVYGPGDYRWKGADLGILVTKGRLQIDRNGTSQLSIRARHFIDCIRAGFVGIPLDGAVTADHAVGAGVKTPG